MGTVSHGRSPPHSSDMVVCLLRMIYTGADLGLAGKSYLKMCLRRERGEEAGRWEGAGRSSLVAVGGNLI